MALTQAEATAESTPTVDESALNMTVAFMGLSGPAGALPMAYTELLVERHNRFRDRAAHEFLDLFTHRAVSLFYRAWRKHRFYLSYEAGDGDGFSRNLLDLVGVGLAHLQQRLRSSGGEIPDRFLIHYAGLLSQKPIAAVNIAALVRGYFAVACQVEQFVGQWMPIPPHEQSALDARPCQLGRNAFIGERLWDRQNKLCLKLGPLDGEEFADFMPGRPGISALRELARFCIGLTLDCDVTLILRRANVPPPALYQCPAPPRLGYNVWLNSRVPMHDPEDVRFGLIGARAGS